MISTGFTNVTIITKQIIFIYISNYIQLKHLTHTYLDKDRIKNCM